MLCAAHLGRGARCGCHRGVGIDAAERPAAVIAAAADGGGGGHIVVALLLVPALVGTR